MDARERVIELQITTFLSSNDYINMDFCNACSVFFSIILILPNHCYKHQAICLLCITFVVTFFSIYSILSYKLFFPRFFVPFVSKVALRLKVDLRLKDFLKFCFGKFCWSSSM